MQVVDDDLFLQHLQPLSVQVLCFLEQQLVSADLIALQAGRELFIHLDFLDSLVEVGRIGATRCLLVLFNLVKRSSPAALLLSPGSRRDLRLAVVSTARAVRVEWRRRRQVTLAAARWAHLTAVDRGHPAQKMLCLLLLPLLPPSLCRDICEVLVDDVKVGLQNQVLLVKLLHPLQLCTLSL